MKCFNCNKEISSNKKFCSNKGRGNCKDKYHNKRGGDLSQARLRYLGFGSQEEYNNYNMNSEGEDDFCSSASVRKCEWCGYIDCRCI